MPASMMERTVEPKIYFRTCAALLALLALTWGIAYVDLGSFNLILALAIALSKAVLIALFFMHIKGSNRLLHGAAMAGIMWLMILIALSLSDYFTRGWNPLK
jgi:cytochrome c oxidase subunit IV